MSYQVTAPLVVARTGAGAYVHIYEGGMLPEDVNEEQLEQLLASKMVAEADAPADGKTKRARSNAGDGDAS